MEVKDLLAGKDPNIITIGAESPVAELATLLATHRVGAVPVTSPDGALVGIISERDVARGLDSHGDKLGSTAVSDLMTTEVITCEPEANIADVVILMSSHSIRHLPVIKDGELKGIISIRDVLDQRLAELELDTDILRKQLTEEA